ncbi:alpha/beta fold hydrolase [Microbulbifer sp. THAF38]|uniref:alpha/beta fold hydrolase n=1 Tax=Microbulbifer sp. THAF38 TaxID=2587856 RepID=UPI001267A00A|nr:alpha/beta hydrolase [Microbulbifer sp. THAF38]QFT53151.1 4,5:9,10-diseco-3-hydroxy-5,9,17-trioxoandrosta-1(10),2-diene-4-oate hydrolase [Microbulbifer sp. THAF38]
MTTPQQCLSAITIIFSILLSKFTLAAVPPIQPQDELLSGYEYPYPVKTLGLSKLGQPATMAYMDVPSGTSAPARGTVLLLHGKNFSAAYWKDSIVALTEQGYRVIAPDQIGFGKSDKPLMQYNLHGMAADTKALLNKLKVDRVSVVGHSMGGMLATRFSLLYPEMVEKLVLINPIGLEDWKRLVPYEPLEKAILREQAQTPEGIKNYMSRAYFDGKWQESYNPLLDIQAGWTLGPDSNHIAKIDALTSEMVFTQPVLYEFEDLKVPTLLIIGTRDRTAIGRARAAEPIKKNLGRYDLLGKKTAAMIPDTKLIELDGVGHLPQFEAFNDYFKALSQFLNEEDL